MQTGPSTMSSRAIADLATRSREQSGARRHGFGVDKVVLFLVMVYLLVPLAATMAFGLSTGSGLDLSTLQRTFSDPDFSQTLVTSLELALGSTLLAILLVTPTAYWVQLRLPRVRPLLDVLSLIPFAMPAIVLGTGLIQQYSGSSNPLIALLSLGFVPLLSNGLNIIATPPLLICAYVIIALPFVYRPIDNSLRAINTTVLTEAAYSLGCGWWQAFLTVIVPNIWPGIISAALLTFSTVMGEFTLASLFNIYTFPIFLNATGQNDAHQAADLAVLSFLFTLICVMGILVLARRRQGAGNPIDLAGAR